MRASRVTARGPSSVATRRARRRRRAHLRARPGRSRAPTRGAATTAGALKPSSEACAAAWNTRVAADGRPDARAFLSTRRGDELAATLARARGAPRRHDRGVVVAREGARGGSLRGTRGAPRGGELVDALVAPRRRGRCAIASAPPGPSPPRTGACPGAGASRHPRRRRSRSRHFDARRSARDGILRGARAEDSTPKSRAHDAVARRRHLPRRARDARRGRADAPVVAEFDTQKQIRHRDVTPTLRTRRVARSTSEKCKLPTHPTQLQDTSPMVRFDHVRLPALISMPTPAVSRLRDPAPSRASRRVKSARRAMPPSFSRSASDGTSADPGPRPLSRALSPQAAKPAQPKQSSPTWCVRARAEARSSSPGRGLETRPRARADRKRTQHPFSTVARVGCVASRADASTVARSRASP